MLKWRIVTTLVLAPLTLALLWFGPTAAVAGVMGVAALAGGREWGRLIGLEGARRGAYVAGLAVLLLGGWVLMRRDVPLIPVFLLSVVWWVAVLVRLVRYNRRPSGPGAPVVVNGAIGYFVVGVAWLALASLHARPQGGRELLLLLLFSIWSADIGAYFTGRSIGRHKLAPNVSPGKTWEGAVGGLVLAGAVSQLLFILLAPERLAWLPWYVALPLVAVTVLFSVVGDLYESMIKRQRGAKDSGTLLPGHGGMLDRVDSLLSAGPIFIAGLLCWDAWRATL